MRRCTPKEHVQFLTLIDRGGLAEPTELCFATTALAVQHYSAILSDEAAKKKLWSFTNQRAVFIAILSNFCASNGLDSLLEQKCQAVIKTSN